MRILIAEDDPVSRKVLETILRKWGYEVISCKDGAQAWDLLQLPEAPSIAILDWMMPRMDGVEVCRRVRQQNREPYIYVVLLTAKSQRADVVEGMEAGADDYLTKPFDHNELKARLRAGRRLVELQIELVATREALRTQATRDPLTACWNRTALYEILGREVQRSEREQVPVSVVMADFDHFKSLNDTYGHQAGDTVLREAARRMMASARYYDSVGRYGGEEFLIVLPGCDRDAGVSQAERLRSAIVSTPFSIPGHALNITCSLGVASTAQNATSDVDVLVNAADAALYRAKREGRDRVTV